MIYDRQILKILSDVGERGLSIQSLSRHLYNMNATFFTTVDINEIRSYVQKFLLRNSRSPQSLIESTGKRGYYRLNTKNSQDARKLLLEFRSGVVEDEQSTEEKPASKDLSLSLFD